MASPSSPDAKSPGQRRSRVWGWLLAGLLGLHLVQSVRLFPTVRSLVDPEQPVVMVDHALHLYHGALGARFLREHGTTWGYDPFFMAGYPETPVWDSSSNLAILFQLLAGGRYSPLAYKLGLLACGVLVLPLLAAAAAGAGLDRAECTAAAALGWLYFWVGFPSSLWLSGLFAFVTASAAVALLLGLLLRFDRRPTLAAWAALAIIGTAALWAHVTAPIAALGGLIGLLATAGRRSSWRQFAALGAAAGLALAVNLVWLAPLWRFRGLRTGTGFFLTSASAWYLPQYYVLHPVDGRLSLAILVLGLIGLAAWSRGDRRVPAAAIGGSAVLLAALAVFGSLWHPTRVLEPLRFRLPLTFLLALPAGSAVVGGAARLARWGGGARRGAVLAGVAWLALLGGLMVLLPDSFRRGTWSLLHRRPLAVGLRPEMCALVACLRSHTDPSARILFEDQLRLLEATDPESTHWTPLLPMLLRGDRRQFVGGLYHAAFIAHHRLAAFGDFTLGGRPLDEWPAAALDRYLNRFNIGWVVCWSPVARFVFDHTPRARRVATLPRAHTPGLIVPAAELQWTTIARRAGAAGANRYVAEGASQYAIYRLDRPHSFFLVGRGRVADIGPNRIELRDLEPGPGGEVVLGFHWLDAWRSDPPCRLAPAPVPGDPVGFVRLAPPGPTPRLVLENGYGWCRAER